MKKFISFIIISVMVCGLAAGLAACNSSDGYSYVTMKINPEINMVVDKYGKVISYSAENSDADILLSNTNLNGLPVEEAAEKVVSLAVEAGYIDADTEGEEVDLSVTDSEGNEDTETFEKIEKSVNHYFENNGIFGRISKDTLDNYLEDASQLGYSVGHVKILMLAVDRSGKSLDELKDKSIKELMQIIHKDNGKRMRNRGSNAKHIESMKQKCENNSPKLNQHKNNFENGDCDGICEQIRQYQKGEDANPNI